MYESIDKTMHLYYVLLSCTHAQHPHDHDTHKIHTPINLQIVSSVQPLIGVPLYHVPHQSLHTMHTMYNSNTTITTQQYCTLKYAYMHVKL